MRKTNSKWLHLEVLKYSLHDTCGRVILPAGTKNVDWIPRGGAFTYLNENGERVRVNKYRHNGAIYSGH